METKKKRTEIFSETTTLLILKNSESGTRQNRCEECAAEVIWFTPRPAAVLVGLSPRSIYRLLETGAIHFIEANGDEPQICSRSLLKIIEKGDTELCSQK